MTAKALYEKNGNSHTMTMPEGATVEQRIAIHREWRTLPRPRFLRSAKGTLIDMDAKGFVFSGGDYVRAD